MSTELLRLVDSLARDKNIDKDLVLGDLEAAMETAVKKKYLGAIRSRFDRSFERRDLRGGG